MKINIIKIIITFSLFLLVPATYANEQGLVIVSDNLEVSNLSKKELENIFLGRKTMWENGKRINIAISESDSTKVSDFLSEHLGITNSRFKKYWLKKVFAGYGIAPKIFKNNDTAISFVKRQENSIAFIVSDTTEVMDGYKTITIR